MMEYEVLLFISLVAQICLYTIYCSYRCQFLVAFLSYQGVAYCCIDAHVPLTLSPVEEFGSMAGRP